MDICQIKNEIKKGFQKAACNASVLGKGKKREALLELESYVMNQLDIINKG